MDVTRRGFGPEAPVRARRAVAAAGHATRRLPRRAVRTLLAASVGIALFGAGVRRSAPEWDDPTASVTRLIRLDAMAGAAPVHSPPSRQADARVSYGRVSHGETDDQPAGACWLAHAGSVREVCLCSAGSVEDLLTPDFMRVLLASWRDAGQLTAGEWYGRMWEVDAACRGTVVQ
ncbi:MAG: hypothetical protein NVSMB18_19230 [Acetobacteraceae bacterium]